jgi:hypothetical protein
MKLSPPIITVLQELGPRGQRQHFITQQKETTLINLLYYKHSNSK